jgi:hypothetical protein
MDGLRQNVIFVFHSAHPCASPLRGGLRPCKSAVLPICLRSSIAGAIEERRTSCAGEQGGSGAVRGLFGVRRALNPFASSGWKRGFYVLARAAMIAHRNGRHPKQEAARTQGMITGHHFFCDASAFPSAAGAAV